MAYDDNDLTEPQRQIVAEAEQAILRTLAETRTKLTENGMDFPPGQDGDFSCTRCACEFFMSSRPGLLCERTGCGHSFTIHRVQ